MSLFFIFFFRLKITITKPEIHLELNRIFIASYICMHVPNAGDKHFKPA